MAYADVERRRKYMRAWMREYRFKRRLRILAAYGNACVCCGCDYEPFLTLDHTDGGGAAHRRRLTGQQHNGGELVYKEVERLGFPAGYRILCFNCNFAAYRNGNVCPCPFGKNEEKAAA